VAVGVLAVLALYVGALGPAGRQVRHVTGIVVGVGRFLLPVLLVGAGARLAARRQRQRPARMTIGAVVSLVAVTGLAGLAGGAPGLSASDGRLAGAGGWAGALVADPLRSGLTSWGAGVVFVAVLAIGLVLLTGITLDQAGQAVVGAGQAAGRVLRSKAERRAAGIDDEAAGSGAAVELDGNGGPLAGRRPARRRGLGTRLDRRSTGASMVAAEARPVGAGPEPEADLAAAVRIDRPAADPVSGEVDAGGDGREAGSQIRSGLTGGGGAGGGAVGVGGGSGVGQRRRSGAATDLGDETEAKQLALDLAPPAGDWRLPPLRSLVRSEHQPLDEAEVAAAGRSLVDSLQAHGVDTSLVGYTVGPTVTRFELELGPGVKVARVTSLAKDIAYAMASPDIRILAPIPGKSAIGVEVPNRRRDLVTLGDVLSSPEARQAVHPLSVGIGRDIAGRAVMANLADMPHILISGATGAGKSSCINSILTSIMMRATPEQVRLILVDPKRVELGQYNGLPHLLTEVVVDPKKAANALSWAVKEMERRYDLLAEVGMRDITGYNEAIDRGDLVDAFDDADAGAAGTGAVDVGELGVGAVDAGQLVGADPGGAGGVAGGGVDGGVGTGVHGGVGTGVHDGGDRGGALATGGVQDAGGGYSEEARQHAAALVAQSRREVSATPRYQRLPFVLVVVDELNDLMMVAARDVEESVCRIAQMARAVGIHLVLATQRPSVDVITGVIKANVPSRLAFSVSSLADSRVILDQPGAERLVGKGDMLLLTASSSVPRRIQGPWVSEEEVRSVVGHWRRQRQPQYVEGIAGDGPAGSSGGAVGDDDDELLGVAMDLVVRSQLGSTSMLQRKLRVGFARAGRLMDLLERRGVVGPSEGSKARAVLMTPDELEEFLQR